MSATKYLTVADEVADSYCNPSQWHEAANIFPLMSDDDLQKLAADIKANGQKNPIILLNGKVLDGRNRALACRIAGVRPDVQPRNAERLGSPVSWVISQNLQRRHLDAGQRAMIAVEAEKLFAIEAKQRQQMGKERIPDPRQAGQARDKAAAACDVNPRYVQDAKTVAAKSPEAATKVASGELSLPAAMRQTAAIPMPDDPEKKKPSPAEKAAAQAARVKKLVAETEAPILPSRVHLKSLAIVLDLLKRAEVELSKVKNVESIEEYEALVLTHQAGLVLTAIEDNITKGTKNLNRHLAEIVSRDFNGKFHQWYQAVAGWVNGKWDHSKGLPHTGQNELESLRQFKRFVAQKGWLCTGGYNFIKIGQPKPSIRLTKNANAENDAAILVSLESVE